MNENILVVSIFIYLSHHVSLLILRRTLDMQPSNQLIRLLSKTFAQPCLQSGQWSQAFRSGMNSLCHYLLQSKWEWGWVKETKSKVTWLSYVMCSRQLYSICWATGHISFGATHMACSARMSTHHKCDGEPITDSKVHGANMGPIWGRHAPCWPHGLCYLRWTSYCHNSVCYGTANGIIKDSCMAFQTDPWCIYNTLRIIICMMPVFSPYTETNQFLWWNTNWSYHCTANICLPRHFSCSSW